MAMYTKKDEVLLSIPLFASYKPVLFIMPISSSVAWVQPFKCVVGELTWLKRLNLQLPHTNVCGGTTLSYFPQLKYIYRYIYIYSIYIHVTCGTHERGTARGG